MIYKIVMYNKKLFYEKNIIIANHTNPTNKL